MPHLNALELHGFRGIREGKLEGLADANILVGRNNSGKTTVLEALARLGSRMAQWTGLTPILGREPAQPWLAARNESSSNAAELWYRGGQKAAFQVKAQMAGGSLEWTVPHLADPQSGHVQVQEGSYQDCAAVLHAAGSFRPADAANRELEARLWEAHVLPTRADKPVLDALRDVFGLEVEQLQLPSSGRAILVFPDHSLPLDVFGDGVRSAVRLLLVLAVLRGTLLSIEEPESHQHAGSLRKLARVLCELAWAQDVQLLVSTHSLECVRAFLDAGAELPAQQRPFETALFHLTLDQGCLVARKLSAETTHMLERTGVDPRMLDLYA
ncbi:MAG: AAA family ATPase [Deltaproteobacteria bacterium]|nr:AAA family ATPase [Deltaproteobacteria bacterium]